MIIIAIILAGCTNLTIVPEQEKRLQLMETQIVRLEAMNEVNHSGTITKLIPLVEIKAKNGLKAEIRAEHITVLLRSGKQCVVYFLSSAVPIKGNDCSELYKLLDIRKLIELQG